MPTPKIRERLPAAGSLKERLSRNITDTDRHMAMGPEEASTATPAEGSHGPAGRKALELEKA